MSNAGFGFSLSMGRNGAIVGWKIIFMVWGASADGALLLLLSSLVFFFWWRCKRKFFDFVMIFGLQGKVSYDSFFDVIGSACLSPKNRPKLLIFLLKCPRFEGV